MCILVRMWTALVITISLDLICEVGALQFKSYSYSIEVYMLFDYVHVQMYIYH